MGFYTFQQFLLIFDNFAEERKRPEQECSICLDDMYNNTDVITLECNHMFHKKCINDWFREKHDCPQCRNYALPTEDFPSLSGR